jgi:3-hydroxyacyl-CoA dehydrogenase
VSQIVQTRREGEVAIVLIDNPPVNALKQEVRAGILEAFQRADADPAVKAIVLAAEGRTFIAGADITEFGKPPKAPSLIEVIAAIDDVKKPTIAAMHGTPLGGGLEITLACHFRLAAPGTKLGLPEIKLGLMPGAGGTQRLPRLVGVEKALEMILSGNPIPAKDALAHGLVDEIVEGDLIEGALAFARKVIAEKRALRRVRDMDEKLEAFRASPDKFAAAAANAGKRAVGMDAPRAAIEAVRWSLEVPIDQALKQERETFIRLMQGDQSKAQRHLFFAEREAAKILGLAADAKAREIKKVAVIGAGTMGGGIAMNFANAGIPVTIIETGDESLKRGMDTITKNYGASVKRGSLAQAEMEKRLGLITRSTSLDAVADADLIIEAVFEEIDIKKKLFADLDRLAKPGAVLATNTSYLDVNVIAQSTRRPEDVLGMHFFSPANIMKLLEVVRAKATAPDVLVTAMSLGRRIGKVPVVVGVCHGFVGNRMLSQRQRQAERLLLEGASPQDVDAAAIEFGFPMGPFAMGDLAGLDIGWRNRKAFGQRAEIADTLSERGHFGQKTGKGFYVYEIGARSGVPNPEVDTIIAAAASRLGFTRQIIDKQEITERLIFPMINEGARILEEGIAYRPGDIDVIWVYGYGWPVWRGGPMFYADQIGLPYIRDQLAAHAARSGDKSLAPSPYLDKLANEGRGFASLAEAAKKSA